MFGRWSCHFFSVNTVLSVKILNALSFALKFGTVTFSSWRFVRGDCSILMVNLVNISTPQICSLWIGLAFFHYTLLCFSTKNTPQTEILCQVSVFSILKQCLKVQSKRFSQPFYCLSSLWNQHSIVWDFFLLDFAPLRKLFLYYAVHKFLYMANLIFCCFFFIWYVALFYFDNFLLVWSGMLFIRDIQFKWPTLSAAIFGTLNCIRLFSNC